MAKAVQALQSKQINRIILSRPAVEAGERLGYLPGTLSEKIDPYLRPLYDALHDMVDPESIPKLLAAGTIEVAPLAFLRGRSLNDSFIVLDEAQNTTPEQMKMFLTRLGFGSKIVVTGDVTQVDLPTRHQVGPAGRPGHPRRHRRRHLRPAHQPRRGPAPAGRPDRGGVRRARRAPGAAGPASGRAPKDMSIEVLDESGQSVDVKHLGSLSRFVLDRMRVHPLAELCVKLVDVDTITELNVKWMEGDGPTDVLAFPMDELRPGPGQRGARRGHPRRHHGLPRRRRAGRPRRPATRSRPSSSC